MKETTVYCITPLIALLWFSVMPAHAQLAVSGTVRDADEQSPPGNALPGAAITIEGTYIGTFTDASGNFRLTNLKPGPVSVRVSLLGYEPQTQTLDLTQNVILPVLLEK